MSDLDGTGERWKSRAWTTATVKLIETSKSSAWHLKSKPTRQTKTRAYCGCEDGTRSTGCYTPQREADEGSSGACPRRAWPSHVVYGSRLSWNRQEVSRTLRCLAFNHQPHWKGQVMGRIAVLDHGYIELVESWGSDESIICAARMSTGKGFQGWGPTCDVRYEGNGCDESVTMKDIYGGYQCPKHGTVGAKPGDEKLLKFLWDNKHATPFEMGGLVIEVQAPIFVFREWHRHRTQCLHPDTLVHFDAPKSRDNRRFVYKMRIEDIWKKWQPTTRAARPERQTNPLFPRSRIQAMQLRNLDEEQKEFQHSRIVDVIKGSPKDMVRVTTSSGRAVTLSLDHRVLTSTGWMRMVDAMKAGALLTLEGTTRAKANRWEVDYSHSSSETWRDVVGWEGIYVVSTWGRVKRVGAEPRKVTVGANGYDVVSLNRPGEQTLRTVHSIVLEAFSGPRPEGYEARHLDSNRANNSYHNLEWGTPERNARDRVDAGRQQRLVPVFEEIVDATMIGTVPTYDLAVECPFHNFVADGFVVHNSYNEMSARYTPLPDVNYIPTVERLMINSKTNKQAGTIKGAEELDDGRARDFISRIERSYIAAEETYQWALRAGVPKELARIHLPVGRYSRMRASANLRNWLAFLTLRMAPAAQYEIRQFANAVSEILRSAFPRTHNLFASQETST